MPGLNIELTGPLFIIIELPGIVDPGSGRGHMPDESHRVGAHRREAGGEIVVAFRHPVKLPVQVPPQKFLGDKLGIVAVAAAVEITEDHFLSIQWKMYENIPADFYHQPVRPQIDGQNQFFYHNRHHPVLISLILALLWRIVK